MNRSIDCSAMLSPSANRKAPLKKAPRSWARAHPKERSWGDVLRSVTCTATSATMNPMRSFNCMGAISFKV